MLGRLIAKRGERRARARQDRAERLRDAVSADLADGTLPPRLTDAVVAALGVADARYAAGQRGEAAAWFGAAVELAFHRVVHFDRGSSPLAEDPGRFTAPFRESVVAGVLRGGAGVSRRSQARSSTTGGGSQARSSTSAGGRVRVAVVTRRNDNFLGELLDHLGESTAYEVRFVRLADDGDDPVRRLAAPAKLAERILTGDPETVARAERAYREHLDWADVVFLEWCTAPAVLLTLIDPGDTRVVLRLHSYEVFSAWPHLVDLTRVDDLLFVSEHIRDLAVAAVPALSRPGAPRLRVLPLGMRLERFVAPKPDHARFTLGLVGWGSAAKDPLWAFDVLRALRRRDDRYRLHLVGGDFEATRSAATAGYAERLRPALADLEAAGAVRRTGRTDDVPAALTDVGVILSSSVRESFHAGLVEGAASGAVPVVRDWPYFAHRPTGARTLFPDEWVVADVDQAVRRILAATADPDTWREAGAEASGLARDRWDWEQVKGGYDDLLRPPG